MCHGRGSRRGARPGPTVLPAGTQTTVVEVLHLLGYPGAGMNTVGDRLDAAGPGNAGEQLPALLGVKPAHTIGPVAQLEGQGRGVERTPTTLGRHVSPGHDGRDRQSKTTGPRHQHGFGQTTCEGVDTGRHRCVSGEQRGGTHQPDGLAQGTAGFDVFGQKLEQEKAGVTFVEMKGGGVGHPSRGDR